MLKTLVPRVAIALLVAATASAQTPAPKLAFEVASVKPAGPLDPMKIMAGQQRIGMNVDAARIDIGSLSLSDLICLAFRVKPYQVSGPDWIGSERFSIQATLPDGADKEQVPEMLQTLLADRFKLTFHRDDKEQSIYALVVGKGGSKLKESAQSAPDEPADPAKPANPGGNVGFGNGASIRMSGSPDSGGGMVVQAGGANGAMRMAMGPDGTMKMSADKMTLAAFTQLLSRFLGQPVEDQTDLKGNYQIAIDLTMEDMRNAASSAGIAMPAARANAGVASDPSGSSLFQSVQQLGLKLEPRKSPVGRIVIDHLERKPVDE